MKLAKKEYRFSDVSYIHRNVADYRIPFGKLNKYVNKVFIRLFGNFIIEPRTIEVLLDPTEIHTVNEIRDLRVTLVTNLSFTHHINKYYH